MALNLAQALGILVQSAQSHLDGELLASDADRALLKESIDLLMETEQKLEKERNEITEPIHESTGDGPSPDPAI